MTLEKGADVSAKDAEIRGRTQAKPIAKKYLYNPKKVLS